MPRSSLRSCPRMVLQADLLGAFGSGAFENSRFHGNTNTLVPSGSQVNMEEDFNISSDNA